MKGQTFDPEMTRCENARGLPRGGDCLENKYGIERELGRGSIGIVYAAWHVGLDRRVAIKVLRPELARDQDAIARFRNQAKAAAAITSEGAVKVFDVGRLASGVPYIVMEYLEGEDLARLVAEHGPLDPMHAIDLVLSACEPIEEAHRHAVVHRAIQPKNLFAPRDATVTPLKVLDFGVTKSASSPSSSEERRAIVTTASAFNAPEHFSGGDVDRRADIWSLGATLHFLVTGRAPFEGDRAFQVCAKILSQDPPRLRTHRADAPEPLERVIAKCMRRAKNDRYQSVRELVRALHDVKREIATAPPSSRVPSIDVRDTVKMRVASTPHSGPPSFLLDSGYGGAQVSILDPECDRRSALALAAICGLVLFVALALGFSFGTRAIATSKRVAVTTSTSPQLFARP